MTELTDGELVSALARQRACTAPDLSPAELARLCAIEAAPAECLCGRCDGQGLLYIRVDGTEERRPHPAGGRTGYLPSAARGDWWAS